MAAATPAALGGAVADVEGASKQPTPDDIAERGQLRGLGEELMRMAVKVGGNVEYSWLWNEGLRSFLRTAAPGSFEENGYAYWSQDTTLLFSLGEKFLELHITKDPEAEWREWLFSSVQIAATDDSIDVFRRLFALCENSQDFWAGRVEDSEYYRVESRTDLLLIYAAKAGSTEVLSALFEHDRFLSAVRDVHGLVYHPHVTALTVAAENGHRGSVAVLIKAGTPLDYTLVTGETALTLAVEHGHEDVVLELLAAGADVESTNDKNTFSSDYIKFPGFNSLGIAAAKDNEGMVDTLLAAGAGFGTGRMDTPPIIIAAQAGCCGSLKQLLVAGADANAVDSRGQSAVHAACCFSHKDALELLLQHSASLTSRCDEGLSPYDVVAQGALRRRETWRARPFRRGHPATLDVVETSAADRIYDVLLRAGAWGRRGWLIMMRARRLAAVQLLEDSSSEKTSSAEQASPENNDDQTKEPGDGGVDVAFERLTLQAADTPLTSTPPGVGEQKKSEVSMNALSSGGDHDGSGQQAGRSAGWECAVEWLVLCPDERGVFREILSFL